jgi:predicted nucleotide-binding protein
MRRNGGTVQHAVDKFRELLAEGGSFTYDSFSAKGQYGYPEALSPKWASWLGRVELAVRSTFGIDSPIFRTLQAGLDEHLLGNGPDKFNRAMAQIVGALQTSIDALEQGFSVKASEGVPPELASGKVFIVHGHDDGLKTDLEVFLKGIGLDPVVLHRQPDQGATLLEKFEKHSDVGYAFVLLTPDDVAYAKAEADKDEPGRTVETRARQNVIFEFGFFVGRLGRSRVCCLYKGGVTLPSDLAGLVYKQADAGVEGIGYALLRELKAAGYSIQL